MSTTSAIMRIIRTYFDLPEEDRGAVIALGNFDGVGVAVEENTDAPRAGNLLRTFLLADHTDRNVDDRRHCQVNDRRRHRRSPRPRRSTISRGSRTSMHAYANYPSARPKQYGICSA